MLPPVVDLVVVYSLCLPSHIKWRIGIVYALSIHHLKNVKYRKLF
jgi:hypothetical protein